MRAVVQRVSKASVSVGGQVVGAIDEPGLLVLVGITHGDTTEQAARLAAKLWGLRILPGEKSCSDLGAPLLVISQFTVYGEVSEGAARPGRPPRPGRSPSRCSARWCRPCAPPEPGCRPACSAPR